MSDWGWNLYRLAQTDGAERYWFVGQVLPEEASEYRCATMCPDSQGWA